MSFICIREAVCSKSLISALKDNRSNLDKLCKIDHKTDPQISTYIINFLFIQMLLHPLGPTNLNSGIICYTHYS